MNASAMKQRVSDIADFLLKESDIVRCSTLPPSRQKAVIEAITLSVIQYDLLRCKQDRYNVLFAQCKLVVQSIVESSLQ